MIDAEEPLALKLRNRNSAGYAADRGVIAAAWRRLIYLELNKRASQADGTSPRLHLATPLAHGTECSTARTHFLQKPFDVHSAGKEINAETLDSPPPKPEAD